MNRRFLSLPYNHLLFCLLFLGLMPTSKAILARPLVEGSRPKETAVREFNNSFCSSLGYGTRICRVETSENGDAKFIVQIRGNTVNSVPSPYWTEAGVTPDDFVTYRGDLDGDGIPELILVSNEGMSNGIGISYSTVFIFSAGNPKSQPVTIPIEEFGGRETFVYDRSSDRTLILASYWDNYSTLDPQRGWGLYFIGKWLEYHRGKIKPILNKPTLARRYLFRFQNERFAGGWETRKPYKWLQDRTTHKFYREPEEPAKLVSAAAGKVRAFTQDQDHGCSITIELQDGTTTEATCSRGVPADPRHIKYLPINHLGLWQQRFVFPDDFNPAFTVGSLHSKKVKLETYYSEEFHYNYGLVWFTD